MYGTARRNLRLDHDLDRRHCDGVRTTRHGLDRHRLER